MAKEKKVKETESETDDYVAETKSNLNIEKHLNQVTRNKISKIWIMQNYHKGYPWKEI